MSLKRPFRAPVLARQLFACGAVKIARPDEEGFTLKLHEQHPEARKSPVYFNLRTPDNPKPGPLTDDIVRSIGWQFYLLSRELSYEIIVPVPNAGDPFARALVDVMPYRTLRPQPAIVPMQKQTFAGQRRVATVNTKDIPPRVALLIDDLITAADSKLEAVDVLNFIGLTVKDCLVLIDREQGGREELARRGITLHSVYTISGLLDFYLAEGLIDQATHTRVRTYLDAA